MFPFSHIREICPPPLEDNGCVIDVFYQQANRERKNLFLGIACVKARLSHETQHSKFITLSVIRVFLVYCPKLLNRKKQFKIQNEYASEWSQPNQFSNQKMMTTKQTLFISNDYRIFILTESTKFYLRFSLPSILYGISTL